MQPTQPTDELKTLSKLLLATVKAAGGSARIKRSELEELDQGLALLIDEDDEGVSLSLKPYSTKLIFYKPLPSPESAVCQTRIPHLQQPIRRSDSELAKLESKQQIQRTLVAISKEGQNDSQQPVPPSMRSVKRR